MQEFLNQWGFAAYTSLGFFWMALWAFILGYAISAMIQVFVSQERMQNLMGKNEAKGVALGTFFGFISSSCSFSALASAKSLFQKGASFIASLAFLLASTNLVIELGILVSLFLAWQFVLGEYLGGLLLILITWLLIRLIRPTKLIREARDHLEAAQGDEHDHTHRQDRSLVDRLMDAENWTKVGRKYVMEWQMVWKDVSIGFTVAGIVAAFVPDQFFQSLFINSGTNLENYAFLDLLQHVLVGPLAAFLTFIGSMGNIPLAAVLFDHGVSFAGVMAFIFSDLVVLPVLRIQAKYYGWRMAFFILFLLFAALVISALLLHYGLVWFDLLPQAQAVSVLEQEHFALDYSFFLNLAFLILSGFLIYKGFFKKSPAQHQHGAMAPKSAWFEKTLRYLAYVSYLWLALGLVFHYSLAH